MSKGSNTTRSGNASTTRNTTTINSSSLPKGWKIEETRGNVIFHSNIPMTYYNLRNTAEVVLGMSSSQRNEGQGKDYFDFSIHRDSISQLSPSTLKEFNTDALRLAKVDKQREDFIKNNQSMPNNEYRPKLEKLVENSRNLYNQLRNKWAKK